MTVKRTPLVLSALILAGSVMSISGCSTAHDPAWETAFNNKMNTCERLGQTDLREQCYDDAHKAMLEAMRKTPMQKRYCPPGSPCQ